jgi:transposase InsO family protein
MVRRVVDEGWSLAEAAEAAGVSERTCQKWVGRYRREGEPGLWDRSSEPVRVPHRTPEDRVQAIAALRRLRMTGAEIAEVLSMPLSTVSAILGRIGLGKRSRLEPPEPPNRYERSAPGELVHVDVKKLGRILRPGHRVTGDRTSRAKGKAGWQYLYVAIDDHSRLGFASVYSDETGASAISFLGELVLFYGGHGIVVERVLTDNGTCFKRRWSDACAAHEITVKKTRAYRPQTNGKAERFIRTLLERWAYAYPYEHESQRLAALGPALDFYNRFRPHRALAGLTPLQRVNNLPGTYT